MEKQLTVEALERKITKLTISGKPNANEKIPNLLCDLGLAHMRNGKSAEAIRAYSKAVVTSPNCPRTHNGLAKAKLAANKQKTLSSSVQSENEKICWAIETLRAELKRNPTNTDAIGQLNTFLQLCCDWKDYDDRMKKLSNLTDDQLCKNLDPPVDMHTAVNFLPLNLQQLLGIATHFSQRSIKESTKSSIQYRLSGKHIRIGYVLTGPIKFPLVGGRSRLNADRFEIFCYCLLADPTIQQNLVGDWNDHAIDLSTFGGNSKAVANRIVSDGIQILINLNTCSSFEESRATFLLEDIFAQRPAPIQVVYHSKLGSTGASYMDYFITDKVASPLKFAYGYSEKLAYLPNGMFVCDNRELLIKPQENLKERQKLRRRFQLPESAIVFGVTSSSYQIDPETFACWCEILRRVYGSVLWILNSYLDETKANLKKEAKNRKINPHRLIFIDEKEIGSEIDLANLVTTLIDVVLDTPMCNAIDLTHPMCSGIPIVTLPRESFQSRLTASMLTSLGCEELIAKSKLFYIEMAVNMGNKPELLQQMKDRMWENLPDSNLFGVDQYFNDLGNLYEKMWKLHEMGEKPEHLV